LLDHGQVTSQPLDSFNGFVSSQATPLVELTPRLDTVAIWNEGAHERVVVTTTLKSTNS
jgi:hypothetical protein